MDFLKQSDHLRKHTPGIKNEHDHQTHTDGFGFAWYNNHRWYTYRNPLLYSRVPDLPKIIRRVCQYDFVLGHIRHASESSDVSLENTHPFYYRNHVFLHNGEIHGFPAKRNVVRNEIDADLRAEIKGQTDSESFFYLFLSKLRGLSGPRVETLMMAFLETIDFVESKFEWITLNVVVSDKTHTLVSRYCTPYGRHRPPSLYWNFPVDSPKRNLTTVDSPKRNLTTVDSPKRNLTTVDSPKRNLTTVDSPKRNLISAGSSIPPEGLSGVFPKLIVSSEPIAHYQQTMVPANTLMVIENQTGNVSLSNIRHLRRMNR
jgi:predicted glutamine amidotransferase